VKKTPNKLQEGRYQASRRACSWREESVFLNLDEHVLVLRGRKKIYNRSVPFSYYSVIDSLSYNSSSAVQVFITSCVDAPLELHRWWIPK